MHFKKILLVFFKKRRSKAKLLTRITSDTHINVKKIIKEIAQKFIYQRLLRDFVNSNIIITIKLRKYNDKLYITIIQ